MPFLLFFEECMESLFVRIEAAFPGRGNAAALLGFKMKFEEAKTDFEKRKVVKAVTEYFNVAFWLKDTNHVFLYVNEGCCALILFCPMDEVLFKKEGEFEEDLLSKFCVLGDIKVMKLNHSIRFIEHAVYQGERHVWLDICKCPTYSPSGRVTGTMGSGVDLSLIVPDEIKEGFRTTESIEIPMREVLTPNKITDITVNFGGKD